MDTYTSVILVSQDVADAKTIKGSERDCINSPQLLKTKLLNTKSSAQRPLNCILLEASDDSLQKLSYLHTYDTLRQASAIIHC